MNEKPIVAAIKELTEAVKVLIESNERVERILADVDQSLVNLKKTEDGKLFVKVN